MGRRRNNNNKRAALQSGSQLSTQFQWPDIRQDFDLWQTDTSYYGLVQWNITDQKTPVLKARGSQSSFEKPFQSLFLLLSFTQNTSESNRMLLLTKGKEADRGFRPEDWLTSDCPLLTYSGFYFSFCKHWVMTAIR